MIDQACIDALVPGGLYTYRVARGRDLNNSYSKRMFMFLGRVTIHGSCWQLNILNIAHSDAPYGLFGDSYHFFVYAKDSITSELCL